MKAKLALAKLQWLGNFKPQRRELRIYKCPKCGYFHITSKKISPSGYFFK